MPHIPWRPRHLLPLLILLVPAACQGEKPTTPPPSQKHVAQEPARAKFVVSNTQIDMGEADYNQTRTCPVRVTNVGTAPLVVTLLERSCHCGEVEVPEGEIAPGGEGKVIVKWTPSPGQTGTFLLAVKLGTNDPDVPVCRLELTGRIRPLVRVIPEDRGFLDFQTIKPGVSVEREIKVVSSRLKMFDLEASTTVPGLKTVATTVPANALGDDIQSGYLVKVSTTAGLTSGYLRDRLTLKIRIPEGESWTIAMQIYGEVENGVFQVMPREIEFRKKSVAEEDLKLVRVQFFVPSKDDTLEVERCEPAFLTCNAPKQLKPGLWEFMMRLPADNAEAAKFQPDGFFEGRIFLRSSQSKNLVPVRVKWIAGVEN